MPKFSIVIPVYNREREIARALSSCLAQDGADFEVVVVDDGSTDSTVAAIEAFSDPRVKLVRQAVNRGHAPARNLGVRSAAEEWVIILDSDDELLPGALGFIDRTIREAADPAERFGFMYRLDDGRLSPLPPLRNESVDYAGYLAWLERRRLYDFLACTRRATFDSVRWPDSRWTDHSLYQLDFAKQFRTRFCAETVAMVHTAATNRTSFARREARNAIDSALELGAERDLILRRHGDALCAFAPLTFQMYHRMRAADHLLAGHRAAGLKQSLQCLRATPLLPEAWFLLLSFLATRNAFASIRSWRAPAT